MLGQVPALALWPQVEHVFPLALQSTHLNWGRWWRAALWKRRCGGRHCSLKRTKNSLIVKEIAELELTDLTLHPWIVTTVCVCLCTRAGFPLLKQFSIWCFNNYSILLLFSVPFELCNIMQCPVTWKLVSLSWVRADVSGTAHRITALECHYVLIDWQYML